MELRLGQLVYTSFQKIGFRTLASVKVPIAIQQVFTQSIVFPHWDAYNPPNPGYRATYVHQPTPDQTLFGWLYNDKADDMGRSNVPHFICYYLEEPLLDFQLEIIFTCLQKGPLAIMARDSLSTSLETVVFPDLWSYQSARPGVTIPRQLRESSQTALKQEELIDLFISANEQETVVELNLQTYEQQIANLSFYKRYVIEGIETSTADLNKNATAITTEVIKNYQEYKQDLQRYEQELVVAIQSQYPIRDNTRKSLQRLQQVLRLTNEDIELIEARTAPQPKEHHSNQSIIICSYWSN